MVKFLATLILTLIVFAPACVLVSKFFRMSDQAVSSFSKFANNVDDFSKDLVVQGEKKTVILILDRETAAVYFESGAKEVIVDVDGWALRDRTFKFNKPSTCDELGNCFCLFRDVEISDEDNSIRGKQVSCRNGQPPLKLLDCGLGKAESVNSYTCKNGFVIERLVIRKAIQEVSIDPAPFDAHYELSRRVPLTLTKENDYVLIEGMK